MAVTRRAFLRGAAVLGGVVVVAAAVGEAVWRRRVRVVPVPAAGRFGSSGLGGGGGINCVAVTGDGLRVVAGGDVSGVHRSDDGGVGWAPGGGGDPAESSASVVAALLWSGDPGHRDRVWRATSRGHADVATLWVSEDEGRDWVAVSNVPGFDAGSSRPRVVGTLMAQGAFAGAPLYCFAADGTVLRYDMGAGGDPVSGTFTTIARLGGGPCTSGVLHPSDPGRAFVATRSGVWMLTGVATAGAEGATVVELVQGAAPARAEELAIVNEEGRAVLYAAAYDDGILRMDLGTVPFAWEAIGGTALTAAAGWCSVAASRADGRTAVVAGCSNPPEIPGASFDPLTQQAWSSVVLTDDASSGVAAPAWTSLCDGTAEGGRLSPDLDGGGGAWWGYLPPNAGGDSGNRLGQHGYVPEQLAFSGGDVLGVGTQGVFRFDGAARTWAPAMNGLGVTANGPVVADPGREGRGYVANVDHLCFVTDDGWRTVRKSAEGIGGGAGAAFALALDDAASPARVFLAAGAKHGNADGQVYTHPDPATFAPWTRLGAPTDDGRRPLGIAVRRTGDGVVVLAAVEEAGFFRLVLDTAESPSVLEAWQEATYHGTPLPMTRPLRSTEAPMAWASDATAYAFDRASGVWRTDDAGLTWNLAWEVVSNAGRGGYLAVDPAGTAYVSAGAGSKTGLWRLDPSGPVELRSTGGPFVAPGPVVARAEGEVLVIDLGAERLGDPAAPKLWRSTDGGATFDAALTDGYLQRAAVKAVGMAVDPGGSVAVSMRGAGLIVRS